MSVPILDASHMTILLKKPIDSAKAPNSSLGLWLLDEMMGSCTAKQILMLCGKISDMIGSSRNASD